MADLTAWIEERIAAHQVEADASPQALQALVSACVTLGGKDGTVFGLTAPAGGFPDAPRLYRACCLALGAWLEKLDDAELRAQLMAVIGREGLDVVLPGGTPVAAPAAPDEPHSELLTAVVARLEAAGCEVLTVEESEVPDAEALDLVETELGRPLPEALRAWMATAPGRMVLEWTHPGAELRGALYYDVVAVPRLVEECAQQVAEWLEGLGYYYGVWAEAFPFLETGDNAGYVAVLPDGAVVHLDNEGNTDVNGLRLAGDLASFWARWAALGFVVLDLGTLESVRDHGFGEATPLGEAVGALLGPGDG